MKGKHVIAEKRAGASAQPGAALLAERTRPVFDPATCTRTLRIAGPDYEIALFGSTLIGLCSRLAPGMRLVLRTVTPKQALKDLIEGDVDLALGHFSHLPKEIGAASICEEPYRVAARLGHSRIENGLDLESYLAQDHIVVSAGGGTTEIVDEILAQQGNKRHVVATVPIFLSALAAIASTDAIVTMPGHLIALYSRYFQLRVHDAPLAIPPFLISAAWRRNSHDATVQWIVERIKSEASFTPLTN